MVDTLATPASERSKVTISDVAREANVSVAAVSLALRDKPGVGQETRRRIVETARSLGYPIETLPGKRGVGSMGLVIKTRPGEEPLHNLFYAPVLSAIEGFCRSQAINLLYAQLPVDENNVPQDLPRLLTEQHADGLLVVGVQLSASIGDILRRQGPVVLVDAYATGLEYDSVVTDNEEGGYTATRYLLQRGHRRIAILGTSPHAYPSILQRRKGVLRALAEAGLRPLFADCHHLAEEAATATAALLTRHPDVTAVFAANDDVALAAMRVAQSAGKRVPDDLSVIGFDNISLAAHVTPALTTMRVDKATMGRLAAQLLVNRIEYPDAAPVQAIIRPQLIERESVGNPGQNSAPSL